MTDEPYDQSDEPDQGKESVSGQPENGWPELTSELSSWTPAERRMLLITVAGTLAANLLTVMVVAAAVIFARAESRPVVNSISVVVIGVLGLGAALVGIRRIRQPRQQPDIFVAALALGLVLLLATVILLVLLGKAAGIK